MAEGERKNESKKDGVAPYNSVTSSRTMSRFFLKNFTD